MSLYNAMRPKAFKDLVGGYSRLERLVEKPNHNHTMLFHGNVPGTGKTTISRLFAEKLGAEDIDIREYNFSDKNGIDTVRDIIDGLHNMPFGKVKVYIIDEFHGATPQAQSALRKDLEEPPEHVYFFLCTNNIDKVDDKIRSRALKIEFPGFTDKELKSIVENAIYANEWEETVDMNVPLLIAQKSEGSARTALNILELVVDVTIDEQIEFINNYKSEETSNVSLDKLGELVYDTNSSWKEIAKILDGLRLAKVEAEVARRYLLNYGVRKALEGKVRFMEQVKYFTETTFYNDFSGFVVLCYKAWKEGQ